MKKDIFKQLKDKRLITSYIISFVLAFMLFLYEPMILFVSNSEDFWFTFGMMLKIDIVLFVIVFILLSLFSGLVFYISKRFKKELIFNIYLILLSSGLFILYIQGNYLSSKLPLLDGSPIKWGDYKVESIISVLLIVVIIALNVIFYKKKKEIYNKGISFVAIVIGVLLLTGLIPTLIQHKDDINRPLKCTSTFTDINTLSTNKNFLILVIDMVDSRSFAKVLKDENKEDLLKDFTYFPDTISAYPYTRESIPFMISGKWYELEKDYYDYYNEAFDDSSLLKRLLKENYNINIYEENIKWSSKKCEDVSNMSTTAYKINTIKFIKQEVKYVIFKYFPYPLKRYSKILSMNFNLVRENDFKSDNKSIYESLDDIKLQDNNYFQFLHTEGGHFPWTMDKNFKTIENGTYVDKIQSSIRVIEKYIDRIKKSGQYDNTAIIILSDHGFDITPGYGRQNPSLYIKGANEHHDSMATSDKKVSYVDLVDSIYNDLIDGKKSDELLNSISSDRTRRYIYYEGFSSYNKYYEQTTDGHAWETDKLQFTGKTYEKK